MEHHRVLQVPPTISQVKNWHRALSTCAKPVVAQQRLIDEGRHLVSDAVRSVQCTRIENGGFDAGMMAPELVGQCKKPRVRPLEFVETLHKIAENDELKRVVHIHGEFDNELEVEKSHILGFVNDNHVLLRNADARNHFIGQYVADTGVRVCTGIIILDGHTVVSVDVQIGDCERLRFLFDFVAQHGVVSELDDFG